MPNAPYVADGNVAEFRASLPTSLSIKLHCVPNALPESLSLARVNYWPGLAGSDLQIPANLRITAHGW